MQTLEEKRELLLKAVMGEVELEWLDPNDEWCSLDLNAVGNDSFFVDGLDYEIDDYIFRIAEPRKTHKQWADELAEAIEKRPSGMANIDGLSDAEARWIVELDDLANRYREQESK